MKNPKSNVGYAVVGLGHIAQVAVLPAFKHAKRNSTLVSVVADDRTKRREMAKKYRLDQTYSFAPELLYFSDCILNDRKPEPSGEEGMQDVRIVQALYQSQKRAGPSGFPHSPIPKDPVRPKRFGGRESASRLL